MSKEEMKKEEMKAMFKTEFDRHLTKEQKIKDEKGMYVNSITLSRFASFTSGYVFCLDNYHSHVAMCTGEHIKKEKKTQMKKENKNKVGSLYIDVKSDSKHTTDLIDILICNIKETKAELANLKIIANEVRNIACMSPGRDSKISDVMQLVDSLDKIFYRLEEVDLEVDNG